MHKSVFQTRRNLEQLNYDNKHSKVEYACKVDIKETSTFMINFYSFTHRADELTFSVFTAGEERREVDFYYKFPPAFIINETRSKGEAETVMYKTFELPPNKYVLHFAFLYEKINTENVDVLLKIGSMSECKFEECM